MVGEGPWALTRTYYVGFTGSCIARLDLKHRFLGADYRVFIVEGV